MSNKAKNYIYYQKQFKKVLKEKIPISDKNGEIYEIQTGEEFKQCYNSNKEDKARNIFPPYWFISNYGTLISLNGKTPKKLHPSKKFNDTREVWFCFKKDNISYNIANYQLVALLFGAKFTPKAQELINAKGLKAFGNKKGFIQVHHIKGYDDNKPTKYNCNVETLLICTKEEHDLLKSYALRSLDNDKGLNELTNILDTNILQGDNNAYLCIAGDKNGVNGDIKIVKINAEIHFTGQYCCIVIRDDFGNPVYAQKMAYQKV